MAVAAAFLAAFPSARGDLVDGHLVDGIAAVVNEDIITFTDVKNAIGSTDEALRRSYASDDPVLAEKIRELRKDALDQLIERRLIIQQFNLNGGKVPDSYVEEDIQNTIDEQYGRDRSVFIKTLEALGTNLQSFKDRVRDKIIVRYMQKTSVNDEILISPYKIEKYYREHVKDFEEGEKVKMRMIYISKGKNPAEADSNRSLAQEVLVKVATGSDFVTMANVYSEGPEKKEGGELGFISRETLREELRDAAFSLKPGSNSKVIETSDGFYILLIEEKKPAKVTTMVEARDLVERLLMQAEREQLQKHWIRSLKRKAYIRMY